MQVAKEQGAALALLGFGELYALCAKVAPKTVRAPAA